MEEHQGQAAALSLETSAVFQKWYIIDKNPASPAAAVEPFR